MEQAEQPIETRETGRSHSNSKLLVDMATRHFQDNFSRPSSQPAGDHLEFTPLTTFSDNSEKLCSSDQPAKQPVSPREQLWNSVNNALRDKDYKNAESGLKELLELAKKASGEKSADVADLLGALGDTCASDKRFKDAKKYFEQSAEVCKSKFGENSFERGFQMSNVARMDAAQKNWKDAAASYEAATKVLEATNPASQNHTMEEARKALNDYADVLDQLGEKDKATKQRDKAKAIYNKYLDGQPPLRIG